MKHKLLLFFVIFSLGIATGFQMRDHVRLSVFTGNVSIAFPDEVKEVDSIQLPVVAQVIERDGYTVCYDGRAKNPFYVMEILTADSLKGSVDRSAHLFREDENIPAHLRATLEDYKFSGYDRGHMAPAADCKKSVQRMAESFFLSNVCPQNPRLNRGWWASFEKHVRDLTKQYRRVVVFSGPLYVPIQREVGGRCINFQVIGENDVHVPTHFFKVLRLESDRGVDEEAYVVPNEHIAPETPLEVFQVTVQKVERLSGILFQR